jgi:hypothetical protein
VFKQIKHITVFLLASIILFNSTHLNELGKTPFLLMHYSDHHHIHPEDSFFDFLYKHYIQQQQADSDQDRESDAHLPFKAHTFHFDLSPFLLTDNIAPVIPDPVSGIYFNHAATCILSRIREAWQPPKIG